MKGAKRVMQKLEDDTGQEQLRRHCPTSACGMHARLQPTVGRMQDRERDACPAGASPDHHDLLIDAVEPVIEVQRQGVAVTQLYVTRVAPMKGAARALALGTAFECRLVSGVLSVVIGVYSPRECVRSAVVEGPGLAEVQDAGVTIPFA